MYLGGPSVKSWENFLWNCSIVYLKCEERGELLFNYNCCQQWQSFQQVFFFSEFIKYSRSVMFDSNKQWKVYFTYFYDDWSSLKVFQIIRETFGRSLSQYYSLLLFQRHVQERKMYFFNIYFWQCTLFLIRLQGHNFISISVCLFVGVCLFVLCLYVSGELFGDPRYSQ